MPLYGASILSAAQRCNNPGPSEPTARAATKRGLGVPSCVRCVFECVKVCGVWGSHDCHVVLLEIVIAAPVAFAASFVAHKVRFLSLPRGAGSILCALIL